MSEKINNAIDEVIKLTNEITQSRTKEEREIKISKNS
jgi:hypothetical protein